MINYKYSSDIEIKILMLLERRRMKKIKVAIDSRRKSNNGIGRYVENLIYALDRKAKREPIEIFEVCYNGRAKTKNKIITLNESIKCRWEESQLNEKLLKNDIDIFIAPYYYNTPYIDVPCIRVIHDAIPFHYGFNDFGNFNKLTKIVKSEIMQDLDSKQILKIYKMYEKVIRNAEALVTVSHHSASDLSYYFPDSLGKWNVIYPYISRKFFRVAKVKKRNQLVCVGRYEPRKQQLEIIDSISKIRKEHGYDIKLKLIGGSKDNFPNYASQVRGKAYENKLWVTVKEDISDRELVESYSESILTIFVSKDEGFGYPAIESIACGTPVLVRDRTALQEICSSAAIYYNPENCLTSSILNAFDVSRDNDTRPLYDVSNVFSEERYISKILDLIYML